MRRRAWKLVCSVVKNTFKKYLSNYTNTFEIKYLKYHLNTIISKVFE